MFHGYEIQIQALSINKVRYTYCNGVWYVNGEISPQDPPKVGWAIIYKNNQLVFKGHWEDWLLWNGFNKPKLKFQQYGHLRF